MSMIKISSDSEMRNLMMEIMIEETTDNKNEMMELVNSITRNAEMKKMIFDVMPQKANS